MNNFLYYGTPLDQCQVNYPNFNTTFNSRKEISTQLPKNITVIRVVATLAFTLLAALKLSASIFYWPVVVAGVAFAGWTIYSHLLSADPLMETFYKISGGKNKFEELPEIDLRQVPNEKIFESIRRLNWDDLNQSIGRARTLDGRNVFIIKGLSRNPEVFFTKYQTKGVLAFVEKLGPEDLPKRTSNLPELAEAISHAVLFLFKGNTFGTFLYSKRDANDYSRFCEIYSSISCDMANELFAQRH